MHATTVLSVVLTSVVSSVVAQTLVTGALGNATVVTNNPPGTTYVATLPTKGFFNPEDPRGNIEGSILAAANPSGTGVSFTVNFSNLPTSGGPFLYHLHDQPVPSNGNCTGTRAHLDPFIRGEATPCNETFPQTCQVGDLSGKHGSIIGDSLQQTYTDDFASTLPGLGSFFGNRSITIHFSNKTRITCANFTLVEAVTGGNGTTPVPFTGFGAKNVASVGTVVGVAALALLL